MKRKIFSILFALVLVLTLGLVTAVPALAAAWDITYTTQGTDTSSGLSTDQAKFGDGSAKLALPMNYNIGEYAHVTVEMPTGMVLNAFTSGSYWYYPAAYSIQQSGVNMKSGDADGLAYPTGYMTFYLDTNEDGDADVCVVQYEAFDSTQTWQQDTVSDTLGNFHVEGYTESSYNQGEIHGTLAQVKDDVAPTGSGLAGLGEATLLSVRVETGGWVARDEYTSNPLVTYIDDIEINGITYELEPATGAVDMIALYPAPVIGISVSPLAVDFGSVVPGTPSAAQTVTVKNEGNVAEDFSASIENESPAGVYTGSPGLTMTLDATAVSVSSWLPTGVEVDGTEVPSLVLTVPDGTAPGTYRATLVFWAEAAQ